MKITLALLCIACAAPAAAQNGITNTRDGSGNLVRNTGLSPVRGGSQAPSNNPNATINSTLGPTTPINSSSNKVKGK
jgi:hypothetical protein